MLRFTTTVNNCCNWGDRLFAIASVVPISAVNAAIEQASVFIRPALKVGQPAIVRCVVSPTLLDAAIGGHLVKSDVIPVTVVTKCLASLRVDNLEMA